MTPLTIFKIRSTSPPKSAWPGVSTMLIFTSPYWMAVFLARMVMPRSLLQVAGVHHPVLDLLVGPKGAALFQHLVDEGGFAVVDVGDDGNIA